MHLNDFFYSFLTRKSIKVISYIYIHICPLLLDEFSALVIKNLLWYFYELQKNHFWIWTLSYMPFYSVRLLFTDMTAAAYIRVISLRWRHNDRDGVSNHQPHGCLLNCLFRRRSKITSKLRVTGLCVGNSPGPVNSPHKGPVTRIMFPFDDVIMLRIIGADILNGHGIAQICV